MKGVLIDECRVQQMEEVIAAARRYRDLMRQYLVEQADLAERGTSLDDLVTINWHKFTEVAAAEEELFAAIDAFDLR